MFQPSSDLQAGCNPAVAASGHWRAQVSTLIRPSGRMQLARGGVAANGLVFQPSSDLQAGCNGPPGRTADRTAGRFNPHPTFRPDATCNAAAPGSRWPGPGFNPHPTFRPDATSSRPAPAHRRQPVSTLIRPSGRMQRFFLGFMWTPVSRFNPHPTFRPDATAMIAGMTGWTCGFQPSSDLQAGCNCRCTRRDQGPGSFNPHPTFRPDATCSPRR